MSKTRISTQSSQQVKVLLKEATEQFAKGKESVILKLPNTSKEFLCKLQKTAYDKYCYTVKKKLFNRVRIFNGIVYEYPF